MTRRFLKAILPYLRQVIGLLAIGSLGGLVMNTAVVLPAILLGRTIDTANAWAEGEAASHDVLWSGLSYAGAVAVYQCARLVKRWGLRVGNQRIQQDGICTPSRHKRNMVMMSLLYGSIMFLMNQGNFPGEAFTPAIKHQKIYPTL